MFQNFDLCHSMNAFDPAWIMSGFMEDNFLGDEDINPLTGYSESFKRSLSPTSLDLYERFETASQNFEILKSEGKPLGDAIRRQFLSEQAFNERQDFSFANEARSALFHAVKDGVVDTAEWAVENPFSAAYATGEMALSTAGAVMTGGRNAYEVAFHGKQLKSAAFETAVAFAVTKGAIKAYKGVSRLVARGVSVKKLSLVGGKGVSVQRIIQQNTGLDRMSNRAKMFGTDRVAQFSNQRVRAINGRMPMNSDYAGKVYFEKLPQDLKIKYPHGVPFNGSGQPDFTRYAAKKVQINMTGNNAIDFSRANQLSGYKKTPDGFTWHHHEDTSSMMMIPKDLHRAINHTGGVAVMKGLK